jgi:hypothetical protein
MKSLTCRGGRRCLAALIVALGCTEWVQAQDTRLFTEPENSAKNVRPRWLPWARLTQPIRKINMDAAYDASETMGPGAEELLRIQLGFASPVEVAAARIKTQQSGASARRAAIRYLAGIRCHDNPEAEAALIAALRADRNDAVRLEAAQALAGGCCCTFQTMRALLAVNGRERDGHPAEISERVKAAAHHGLQQYAAFGFGVPHFAPPSGAIPTAPKELQLTSATTRPISVRAETPLMPLMTEAERRFVETAGLAAPVVPRSKTRQSAEETVAPPLRARVPELHLTPIGLIPHSK